MTARSSQPALGDTLRRWREENTADTRLPLGPDGRVYDVPFARVWDELVGLVEAQRSWRLKHRDEEIGIISVTCRVPLLRVVDDLTLWVLLDEHGLTRVEAMGRSRSRKGDLGTNARRISRLLRDLDVAVGATNRLVDRPIDEPFSVDARAGHAKNGAGSS